MKPAGQSVDVVFELRRESIFEVPAGVNSLVQEFECPDAAIGKFECLGGKGGVSRDTLLYSKPDALLPPGIGSFHVD